MLLGLAAGKIGDLVFYRDGGEQRTRTRVIPKNPRSPLQMAQRVKIANVSAFYRLFASVIRDSFTNLPSNQSGYNAFAKQAIAVSPYVTREMALRGSILPAPYAVSKGTLQPLMFGIGESGGETEFAVEFFGLEQGMSTVGAVSAAILANNQGFQNGDKIVCLAAGFAANEDASDADSYIASPYVSVFTIDTADMTTIANAGFNTADQALVFVTPSFGDTAAFAAIHVREDASAGLMVSSAVAALSTAAQSLYDGYRTEQALNEAIASYGVGSESPLRE